MAEPQQLVLFSRAKILGEVVISTPLIAVNDLNVEGKIVARGSCSLSSTPG